jgi:hypothetical protein
MIPRRGERKIGALSRRNLRGADVTEIERQKVAIVDDDHAKHMGDGS